MSSTQQISALIQHFLSTYNTEMKDRIWIEQCQRFNKFWKDRILSNNSEMISDADCDDIIGILDRNAKGNTKDSEVVARAMVAQGAWRRIFNLLHEDKELGTLVTNILNEREPIRKVALIDELYRRNQGQRNHLTGPSGNVISAFLAAHDPFNNLSIISLNDRKLITNYFELPLSVSWETASIGERITATNIAIIEGMQALGLNGSARTISAFFYIPDVKALWRGVHAIKQDDKSINVIVPSQTDKDDDKIEDNEQIRESFHIQAAVAVIGSTMGYKIWLPKSDRGRVLNIWPAKQGDLLDELPFGYEPVTMKIIEQIDVLWIKRRSIVRAFEVEHKTSIYSGLLRMADLVALQPNISVSLHIVAPAERREKVLDEIGRPAFSLFEGGALSNLCSYISYDSIKDLADQEHLPYLSDEIIKEYEERVEND
jgi:hypothetical protein